MRFFCRQDRGADIDTKIFISETVFSSYMAVAAHSGSSNNNAYRFMAEALQGWKIGEIKRIYNRVCIREGDERIPAILSLGNMSKLAQEFKVELADLGHFELLMKKGKLSLSNKPNDKNALSNHQIRAQIAAFLREKKAEPPPVLYADVNAGTGEMCLFYDRKKAPVMVLIHKPPKTEKMASIFLAGVKLMHNGKEMKVLKFFRHESRGIQVRRPAIMMDLPPGLR